ncbi:hypothetical protein ABH941_003394 [Streptacidiphilus sp. EB103A]
MEQGLSIRCRPLPQCLVHDSSAVSRTVPGQAQSPLYGVRGVAP